MFHKSRFHRRRNQQRLVDAAEVMVHVVQGNRVLVVLDQLKTYS